MSHTKLTRYSNTKKSSSFSRITSFSLTTQGWFSLRRDLTSRRDIHSSQLKNLRFIFLMATCIAREDLNLLCAQLPATQYMHADSVAVHLQVNPHSLTGSLVCMLTAFHTLPYVPSPSCLVTLYLGSANQSQRCEIAKFASCI